MLCALPIALRGDVVDAARRRRRPGAQALADLGQAPDIEPAFLALRIRIEARGEGALGKHHLPLQPGDDPLGRIAEQARPVSA